jgi:hypothetical protein
VRTLFDFLRRLLDLKHNEVVALEQLQMQAQLDGLQLLKLVAATEAIRVSSEQATQQFVKMAATLDGIRESLQDRPDAEDYSVAWRVGVPKPEGE